MLITVLAFQQFNIVTVVYRHLTMGIYRFLRYVQTHREKIEAL
jgi:hypothetical protein